MKLEMAEMGVRLSEKSDDCDKFQGIPIQWTGRDIIELTWRMTETEAILAVTREQVGKAAVDEKARRWINEITADMSMVAALSLPTHGHTPVFHNLLVKDGVLVQAPWAVEGEVGEW